jgi:hypothetical protein
MNVQRGIILGIAAVLVVPFVLLPGAARVRAQASSGRPAAESIPSHGYLAASTGVNDSRIPSDYTFVLTRDEIYVPILDRDRIFMIQCRAGLQQAPVTADAIRQILRRLGLLKQLSPTFPYVDKNAVGAWAKDVRTLHGLC